MATNLNPGFSNNINTVHVRSQSAVHRYTDRGVDVDGDGQKEEVTITHVSGHGVGIPSAPGGKVRTTVTEPTGISRSLLSQTNETDRGVVKSEGTEYSDGVN